KRATRRQRCIFVENTMPSKRMPFQWENYPWKSTRQHGCCQSFRFHAERGMAAFCAKKKVKIAGGAIVSVLETLSPQLVALLTGLLSVDPATRMTLEAALGHTWFQCKP
ncbi:unnamed protein product, partial [Polarella glacialis]